jgi:hypothetical protein
VDARGKSSGATKHNLGSKYSKAHCFNIVYSQVQILLPHIVATT